MIIGIDASNIREGGGVTHLKALLEHVNTSNTGFSAIVLWSSQATLNQFPDYPFLKKKTHFLLNKSTLYTFLFQLFYLKKEAKDCEVIFVPGGTFISRFRPFVTMSQNMLPFEKEEAKAYDLKMRWRLKILYYTQSYTFKRANGLIFLTQYARNYITQILKKGNTSSTIIPHGVHNSFQLAPRVQKNATAYSRDTPFEFLYVSYITVYKHQWNIAEAVCQLHQKGVPIKLKLIGSVLDSFEKLQAVLESYPNSKECIEYIGAIPHQDLSFHYHTADAFVFGSTCENLPIILLEAMNAGLPIASSNYGPMGELLGSSAVYFNPKKVASVKSALQILFENHELRQLIASNVYNKGVLYSWQYCANKTFKYIVDTAIAYKTKTK